MNIPSPTFCSLAWDHQFIDPTGRVKPCCRFNEAHRPPQNHLQQQSLDKIFRGPFMQEIRGKMLAGESIPGCARCYEEESSGKKSLRQRFHESVDIPVDQLVNIEKPAIRWLELAISNDCNLACRMCDSRYSWKWYKEEQELFGKTLSRSERTKSDISSIFHLVGDLAHIKFTGGEPLITTDQWRLIDKLIAERDCRAITLSYSTNCTVLPKPEWIEKWRRFGSVDFNLSFDSADALECEYIRWPAKYPTVEAVTRRFLELQEGYGFKAILRSTVSVFNIWHLPQTLRWWRENAPQPMTMNPTHLTLPAYLSVTVLPPELKEKIALRFAAAKRETDHDESLTTLDYMTNFMFSRDDSHLLPELRRYISATDRYRKQSFINHHPHLHGISLADSQIGVETVGL